MKKTGLIKQMGISLLEVMLSLSIIAIVLVMATRYFFVATNNNKINTAISQVGGLIAASHNWKGIKASFNNITMQSLYDAGQLMGFPGLDDTDPSNIAINDLWGDTFSMTPTNDNKATISVKLPTTGNCRALSNAFEGANCNGQTFTYTFS